jgi:hypothetical protein
MFGILSYDDSTFVYLFSQDTTLSGSTSGLTITKPLFPSNLLKKS